MRASRGDEARLEANANELGPRRGQMHVVHVDEVALLGEYPAHLRVTELLEGSNELRGRFGLQRRSQQVLHPRGRFGDNGARGGAIGGFLSDQPRSLDTVDRIAVWFGAWATTITRWPACVSA